MRPHPQLNAARPTGHSCQADHSLVASVAADFGLVVARCERISGGLSGAEVFRCASTSAGTYAIRRWPAGTDAARVAAVHRTVTYLRAAGFTQLAALIPCPVSCSTVLPTTMSPDGRAWHVKTWQTGTVLDSTSIGPTHARELGMLLARLHQTLGTVDETTLFADTPSFRRRSDVPRSLVERFEIASQYEQRLSGDPRLLRDRLARSVVAEVQKQLPAIRAQLAVALDRGPRLLQICLRDLKEDSVLWRETEIAGLIDLGAARVDHPTVDIARLLGAFFREDLPLWNAGLEGYEAVRSLSTDDHQLIRLYVDSEIVLSSVGWVDKLWWQPRAAPPTTVERLRFEHFAARLLKADRTDQVRED